MTAQSGKSRGIALDCSAGMYTLHSKRGCKLLSNCASVKKPVLECRQQANQKAHQEYLDSVRRKEHEREAERKADEARKTRDEV